jgi:hypothetical protein
MPDISWAMRADAMFPNIPSEDRGTIGLVMAVIHMSVADANSEVDWLREEAQEFIGSKELDAITENLGFPSLSRLIREKMKYCKVASVGISKDSVPNYRRNHGCALGN